MTEAVRDELWRTWVENVCLLELHTVELSAEMRVSDTVQTVVLMADLKEPFPEFPK